MHIQLNDVAETNNNAGEHDDQDQRAREPASGVSCDGVDSIQIGDGMSVG